MAAYVTKVPDRQQAMLARRSRRRGLVCVPASNNQLISTPIIGLRSPIAFGSHALRINGVISRLQ
jgi:hypothetical protein